MTIRDLIKRRTRLVAATLFGGWLLFPISALFTDTIGRGPPSPLFFVGFAVFGASILAMLFWIRCPKCGTQFGQLAMEIGFHWGTHRKVNYCPYCGVGMDEAYEPPRKLL